MPSINQLFSLVKSLSLAKRGALIICFILMIILLMRWKPIMVGFSVLAAIIFGLLLRTRALLCQVKFPLLRRIWRGVFLFRGLLRFSPGVELLHIVTLLLTILSVLYLLSTQDLRGSNLLSTAALTTLLGSVVIDSGAQVFFLAKKAWARTLGKVALAATGAILYYVADIVAKNAIHWVTHADPKYFPDATGLLISEISPMLYLALGSVLAFVWALVQLMALGILFLVSQSMGMWGTSSHSWDRTTYRIRTGHKAPVGYKANLFSSDGFLFLMRPFGLLIAVGYLWSSIGALTIVYSVQLNRHIQDLVVLSEFREDTLCHNLSHSTKVAYLNSGLVSVVETTGTEKYFSIRRCELD